MSTGTAGGGGVARGEGPIQEGAEGGTTISGSDGSKGHPAEGVMSSSGGQGAGARDSGPIEGPVQAAAAHDGGPSAVATEDASLTHDTDHGEIGGTVVNVQRSASRTRQTPLDLTYPIMRHPQPAASHRYYPNITPDTPFHSDGDVDTPHEHQSNTETVGTKDDYMQLEALDSGIVAAQRKGVPESRLMDRRGLYDEIEDDYAGYLFSASDTADADGGGNASADGSGDGDQQGGEVKRRYVEWHAAQGRKRWVGPML